MQRADSRVQAVTLTYRSFFHQFLFNLSLLLHLKQGNLPEQNICTVSLMKYYMVMYTLPATKFVLPFPVCLAAPRLRPLRLQLGHHLSHLRLQGIQFIIDCVQYS